MTTLANATRLAKMSRHELEVGLERLEAENLALREATRWRDPKIEPPDGSTAVLVLTRSGKIFVYSGALLVVVGCVRYMPLPAPPKEGL